MSKKIRKINSTVIFSILILILIISMIYPTSTVAKAFNAKVVLEIDWDVEETQKPIMPRDEIKELDLLLKFRIVTDEYVGKGVLIGYAGVSEALIDVNIVDYSPWCSVVLNQTRVALDISAYDETTFKLYLIIDETAPAYVDGYIKIEAKCPYGSVGLIEGFEDVFELHFTPAYVPIIKTNLPEINTKRINPTEKAVFPIEIENAGNARTKVLFELENVPEGWGAIISDEIILEEAKGSKATAYLTVIPPDQFGFHYEEANIRVKMTPARAEDPGEVGEPLYATFTVQNRGSSTSGIEQIMFLGIIVILILVAIVLILKWMRRRQEKTVS